MATASPQSTRSMFGSQVNSKRSSAPSYGFGSSNRQHASKMFISQEHAALSSTGAPPGPSAYSLKNSIGAQPDARKASAPTWAFGTAERFTYEKKSAANPGPGAYQSNSALGAQVSSNQQSQPKFGFGTSERKHVAGVFVSEEHNKARHGIDSPGPMAYNSKGAFNKQDVSKQKTAPSWVFGSSGRFNYEHVKRAATSPGPGAYNASTSVGNQVQSTRTSAPQPGFGTSNREHQAKCYLSPEHEKINAGKHSPGPVSYTLHESTGRQTSSKNQSMPSWGFGTANRWTSQEKATRGSTPGPGSYVV
mmetsp:Transcript_11627/g.24953  ORF Transcript_11627/g.24953 Transcript_11627/m.24953 type:complete len:305 (-) Transcript_11627:744-1658(-)